MAELIATTVWLISAPLIVALDERLGTPVDSFVNGSQTWLTNDGPGEIMLEWRLHPVAGYRVPAGLSHYDVLESVVSALATGADAGALTLGDELRSLNSLWDGLECFAAYGDEVEPQPLSAAVTAALGIAPDYAGLVDHEAIGDEWERTQGNTSIITLLASALSAR